MAVLRRLDQMFLLPLRNLQMIRVLQSLPSQTGLNNLSLELDHP